MTLLLFAILLDVFFNLIGLAGILSIILAIGWGTLVIWEHLEEY